MDPLAVTDNVSSSMPEPMGTSYKDAGWRDGLQTNLFKLLAEKTYDPKRRFSLGMPMEHAQVKKTMDALQNRGFEAAKKSAKVIGLRLFYGSQVSSGEGTPEFDLQEAAAVFDAEPYVRSAITRQLNIWFKEPFNFMSPNDKLAQYVEKRFSDMAFVTGVSTFELFKMTVRDLLKLSNAFWLKYRHKEHSGVARAKSGRPLPVAGYYPVSAMNMFPSFNNGKLEYWTRYVGDGGTPVRIDPRDVIHFTFDREPDFMFGKPRTLGAVEDIAALRRIEENIEILLVKYLFPLFQFTVGTETAPATYLPDGTPETQVAESMVENMDQNGMFIGTERHKIDVIGAKSSAMDARHYLAHFKARVLMALGVSPIDMGEGDTTKGTTADNISQNLKERVMEDQAHFVAQLQQSVISELLLEHPEDISAVQNHTKVVLNFPDVDLDRRIKKENHAVTLWNADLVSRTETRMVTGRMAMTQDEEADTRFALIDMPNALIAAVDEPFSAEAKAAVRARTATAGDMPSGGSVSNEPKNRQAPKVKVQKPGTGTRTGGRPAGAKNRPGTPQSRTATTKNQPTNQHGTKPSPKKGKSSLEAGLIGIKLSDFISKIIPLKEEEAIEIIDIGFPDTKQRQIIKGILKDTDLFNTKIDSRRATLFAELLVHAEAFKEN